MKSQTVCCAIVKENGVITKIGRSTILQPKPQFKGGSVKWFDDSKLLKTNKAQQEVHNILGWMVHYIIQGSIPYSPYTAEPLIDRS